MYHTFFCAALKRFSLKGDLNMKYRELGRTGWSISTISFGTWAIGSAGAVSTIASLLRRCTEPSTGR